MTYPYAKVVGELTKNITSVKPELQKYLLAEKFDMSHLKELSVARFKWDVKRWTRNGIFEGLETFGELIQLMNRRDDVAAEFRTYVTCKIVTTRVLAESPTVAAKVAKLMAGSKDFAVELLMRTAVRPTAMEPLPGLEADSAVCSKCDQSPSQRVGLFAKACLYCR